MIYDSVFFITNTTTTSILITRRHCTIFVLNKYGLAKLSLTGIIDIGRSIGCFVLSSCQCGTFSKHTKVSHHNRVNWSDHVFFDFFFLVCGSMLCTAVQGLPFLNFMCIDIDSLSECHRN